MGVGYDYVYDLPITILKEQTGNLNTLFLNPFM